jgi:hypothetical protein
MSPMTRLSHNLEQTLTEAREIQKRHGQSLAVFDLDSTLFDVSPRLLRILRDFAELESTRANFPEAAKIMKNIEMKRSDWGIKQALIRAGLDHQHPDFHLHLKNHWETSFFSNHYLQYDLPYEGAVEFVNQLQQAGSSIVYLTGRDVTRMGTGSGEILKKWGFPLENSLSQLVLKPKKGMDDARFKSDWFLSIPKSSYGKIWFFENEPVNIHLVRKEHPEVDIVFFESTHSGKAEAPHDLPYLVNFLIQKGGE